MTVTRTKAVDEYAELLRLSLEEHGIQNQELLKDLMRTLAYAVGMEKARALRGHYRTEDGPKSKAAGGSAALAERG